MNQKARTTKQLGSIIRRARRAADLTQSELGERVGLRQATISKLESGQPNTRLETLMDAMSALGLEFVVRHRGSRSEKDQPSLEDLF